jgi:hypothetical protein
MANQYPYYPDEEGNMPAPPQQHEWLAALLTPVLVAVYPPDNEDR